MPTGSGSPWWLKALKGLFWAAAVLVALVLVLYLALWPMALSKEKAVEKRWADDGMPLAGFLEGLPRAENDAAAERLCAAVAKLGFSIRPKTGLEDKAVQRDKAERWEKVKGGLQDYGQAELEKPGPDAAPPAGDTAAYLEEMKPVLEEVRGLLQKENPVWISEPQKGMESAIPNLLAHIQLTKLLVADALRSHAAGQDGPALEDLEAAWRLSEPLEARHELISQLIVIAIRKMDMGALRKLDGVPQTWPQRLERWDPHKGLVTAYRVEAASYELGAKTLDLSSAGMISANAGHRFLGILLRPYVRLGAADAAGRLLSMIQEEKRAGACPSDDAVLALGLRAVELIPWWNLPGKIIFPNLGSSWLRAKYARIQEELTGKVLQLKAARSETSDWPKEAPGIEKSFCAKEKWTYALTSEGGMSLSFSGPMPAKDFIKGTRYPQEYREAAKKAASPPPPGQPKAPGPSKKK